MKIVYKSGDLLECNEHYFVQGCNSRGVQNSGLAKIIREKWPHVFDEYHKIYVDQGNHLELGQIIPVDCDGRVLLNVISQKYYGRNPNIVYVAYDAIRIAVKEMNRIIPDPIAFPLIGAGLANGSWKIISQIIEEESTNFQPVVYLNGAQIPYE
jgi:O-acetyl-ADP-ribose deacetylase (regulator of RNase III)